MPLCHHFYSVQPTKSTNLSNSRKPDKGEITPSLRSYMDTHTHTYPKHSVFAVITHSSIKLTWAPTERLRLVKLQPKSKSVPTYPMTQLYLISTLTRFITWPLPLYVKLRITPHFPTCFLCRPCLIIRSNLFQHRAYIFGSRLDWSGV